MELYYTVCVAKTKVLISFACGGSYCPKTNTFVLYDVNLLSFPQPMM